MYCPPAGCFPASNQCVLGLDRAGLRVDQQSIDGYLASSLTGNARKKLAGKGLDVRVWEWREVVGLQEVKDALTV